MRHLRSLALGALAAGASLLGSATGHAQLFDGVGKDLNQLTGTKTTSVKRFWMSADYLYWQTTGSKLPPLVTSNPLGTAANEAGVIGVPSTTIIAGGSEIFDEARSGMRWSGGINFCDCIGIEGDYFAFADEEVNTRIDGATSGAILGRPFINLNPAVGLVRYDTQLFQIPPDVTGSVNIRAYSEFQGGGMRGVFHIVQPAALAAACGACDDGCDACDGCGAAPAAFAPALCNFSLSMMMGYRTLSLGEGIRIDEQLITVENGPPAEQFDLVDQFDTESRFDGIELGVRYGTWCDCVGVDFFGLMAAGINNNEVRINGQTAIDNVVQTTPGGLLTQTSNIGVYEESIAAISTQFGVNLNARLLPCMIARVGYSGLFWSNVARPGEQIDLRVNPDLFPPPVAAPGVMGAQPTHRLSDFFAHGLNAGVTVTF